MVEGILIGAGVYVAGLITGRFWPARRKGPKPVQPVCGCSHHHSYHDPKTGECHGTEEVYVPIRDANNKPVKDAYGDVQKATQQVPCTCLQYTGPQPLPEFYAEEITS